MHRKLCTASLAVALAAAPPTAAQEDAFLLDEVRPGIRGTGYSVFQGSEPEPFDVELLGVWRDVSPDTSFVLARLSGRGLEESGVIAGMSGSPVYVDGRLLGAVAFSWAFSQEAIAGITPIEIMRRLDEPFAGVARIATAPAADLAAVVAGRVPVDSLREELREMMGRGTGQGSSGLLWTLSGASQAARELFVEAAPGALASAGRSDRGDGELAPGDAVSAVLVDGDLRMAATGTVTSREGERVLAFGHPFLGAGEISVPMAEAEVLTVVSSRAQSFKVANTGPVVGAFELDRAPGVRGRLGAVARTVPVEIAVRGGREAFYSLQLADLPQLLPGLLAIGVLGSIDATTQAGGEATLDLSVELGLRDREPVVLEQAFDGRGTGLQAATYVLAVASVVLGNGLEEVDLTSARISVNQSERRFARVLEAHPDRRVVSPGDTVRLSVKLGLLEGPSRRVTLDVPVPEDLEGRYFILVGDGSSVDAARVSVEKRAPETLDQLLGLVRSLSSRRRLAALGLLADSGLRVAGETLPRLPGSLQSIWAASDPIAFETLELAGGEVVEAEMEWPLTGLTRVDVEVRARTAPGGEGRGDG